MSREVLAFIESYPQDDPDQVISAVGTEIREIIDLTSMPTGEWSGPDDDSGCGRLHWPNGMTCSIEEMQSGVRFSFYVIREDRNESKSMTSIEDERRSISDFMRKDLKEATAILRSIMKQWAKEGK